MSRIKVNSLSLLDNNEQDCLILTYVDMQNNQIRKRLMPIRAELWSKTLTPVVKLSLPAISSDTNHRLSKKKMTNLLQSIKVADCLKQRHQFYLADVDNRKLVQLLLALKLHKQITHADVIQLPTLSWSNCEQNAILVMKECQEDFTNLSSAIERIENQLLKPIKKQVSFKDIPEQFHFEKYEGEEEFNSFNANQYLDGDQVGDDDDDDDDFVF